MSTPKKSTIFTAGPLPLNRQTSQQFQSYDAIGAPCSIGDLRITMAITNPRHFVTMFLSQLWAIVLAYIQQGPIVCDKASSLPPTKEQFDLSPRPALVISITNASENKTRALETAGFGARTNGRYKYYVGPSTDDAVRVAIKEGVATDAFAPGNAVSVNGLILFSIMSRILYHAFAVLSKPYTITNAASIPSHPPTPIGDGFKLRETNLAELPSKGFFFAYFDGLLLPDHGTTLTTFIRLFSPLFGTKATAVAEATRTFGSGWSSLSNTIAGKEYSHMLYCIQLAVSCGVAIRPVYLAGQYAGCVFDTSDCIVNVGSQIHVPQSAAEMKSGIERMQSHESALDQICAILTDLDADVDESEDVRVISPASITSARALHYAFKTRTLGPDTQAKIAPLLRKLRFEQKLWDVTNPQHVKIAVAHLVSGTFPDASSMPMNLRLDAVFTKQPIYSVLAAFGTKAPSLRGSGTQIVRRIAPRFYESLDKPGRVVGIPVFAKSHQEAKEDWEGIRNEFTVFFDHKGKDKEGKLRVKNVSSFIPFDTDEAKAVMRSLVTLVQDKGKKRAIEERAEPREMTEEELAQDAKRKRRKEKGYGMLGLTFGLAGGEGSGDVGMDSEDDDLFA